MPVLSSPIGFLYLLALISSEPVAIGAPPVTAGDHREWMLGSLGAPKWVPKWVPFLLHFFMSFWPQNGLQNGPKTIPKVVNFGIHLWIPFL